jgi:hypothetical protein
MLGTRLVRLIERHSEVLSGGLTEVIRKTERTSDFRKISPQQLQAAVLDVYRHLGEWLLQKTESEIEGRFRAVGARRAGEGIRLEQMIWGLMLSRDHLLRFLRREGFADSIVLLHGELEVHQLLNQFFDRAIYYAILGYEAGRQQQDSKNELARARGLAIAIGLMSPRPPESESVAEQE